MQSWNILLFCASGLSYKERLPDRLSSLDALAMFVADKTWTIAARYANLDCHVGERNSEFELHATVVSFSMILRNMSVRLTWND